MSYQSFLARKLSLGSRNRGTSPAVRVAIVAVSLSVAVMLAAIAVVTGFKNEITEKVIGFNSHITAYADPLFEPEDNVITLSNTLREILDEEPYVESYSLETAIPAVLKTPDDFKGIYFKMVEGVEDMGLPARSIVSGTLDPTQSQTTENQSNNQETNNQEDLEEPADRPAGNAVPLLVSEKIAKQLRLKAGDPVEVFFFTNEVRVRPARVAAIYNTRFDKYDDIYVYGRNGDVSGIVDLRPSQGTTLRVMTDDFDRVDENTLQLQQRLNRAVAEGDIYKPLRVENALQTGAQWFQWLALLDTNVVVILVIMTIIACVTLISGMLIIILEKVRLIGLLRSLGATTRGVGRIFVLLALRIAGVGLLVGNALMLALIWVQERTSLLPLDPDTYYLDHVPVSINAAQVLVLNGAVLAVIFLTLLVPSGFVARISPSTSLRYE